MGLAGQRDKQRISADPNNLHWSKDESKFGFKMLQKMGWAPGKGLGINEDGTRDHVKIKLKDDTLGLGANKKNTDNWLGNTDAFSRLLADLNSRTPSEASSEATSES
ncbi:G-patch domain-containing protein, partial [Radiomyces spectabilis]|uniref:G-patch domain-containing protein n=1 Tax=Radiomyces spectabilis TaxID=64574 RepID=UPI002220A46D